MNSWDLYLRLGMAGALNSDVLFLFGMLGVGLGLYGSMQDSMEFGLESVTVTNQLLEPN